MRSKLSLVCALVIFSVNVYALETPKVKLGGRMDFMAGSVKESTNYRNTNPVNPNNGQNLHNNAFVNDTKIDLNIDGKIDKDTKYGGFLRIHTDTSKATNGESSVGDKTMVYMQHEKIGRIEAGNMPGAGGLFEMGITFLNTGSWGVEGFWSQWVQDKTKNFATISQNLGLPVVADTRGVEFITGPNLVSNYSGNHYSDSPKVNFYTKPHKSVTLGVAYIPDMDSTGTIAGIAPSTAPLLDIDRPLNPASYKHIVSGGVTIDHQVNSDWGIKASVVGEVGKAKVNTINNLKAMEAGLGLSYKNLAAVGSYGNWFKSLTLKKKLPGTKQGGEYFTLGLGYKPNKLGLGLTYLNSKRAGGLEVFTTAPLNIPAQFVTDKRFNRLSVVSLDIDYKIAPGLLPYINVTSFNFKEAAGFKDKGNMVVIGSRLLF